MFKPVAFYVLITHLLTFGNFDSLKIAHRYTMNILVGNMGITEKHGNILPQLSPDSMVTLHLEYVVRILSENIPAGLTWQQLKNRRENLLRLEDYIDSRAYPVNHEFNHNQPIFIDKYNSFCAVGHLIKETAGESVARRVNKDFKYSYIYDIDSPILEDWAATSGFTFNELQMIQPSYYCPDPQYRLISEDAVQITTYGSAMDCGMFLQIDTITKKDDLLPALKSITEASDIVATGQIIQSELLDSSNNLLDPDTLLMSFEERVVYKRYQYVINMAYKGSLPTGDTLWTENIPVPISFGLDGMFVGWPYYDSYSGVAFYTNDSSLGNFNPHPSLNNELGHINIPLLYASFEEVENFTAISWMPGAESMRIVRMGKTTRINFIDTELKTVNILNLRGQRVHQARVLSQEYIWTAPDAGKYFIDVEY